MSPLVCGVNLLLNENEESTVEGGPGGRGVEHHFYIQDLKNKKNRI